MTQFTHRPASQVMDVKRLGAMHQTRMSFMRRLMRQMCEQEWDVSVSRWQLDDNGYGTAVYRVQTSNSVFHQVLFSKYLADEDRNDRVIADKWDVTMALCFGEVSDQQMAKMQQQVPLQEAGRASSNMLVLSRGNKSSRNFDYVVEQLAEGNQPDIERLGKVGYLFRTTAVYGSGKFGLADWQKVQSACSDLAYPFAAEMLSCYLLRQFSLDLADYLAQLRAPLTAAQLQPEIKRYIGIGNSTGLGMAPYLIRHPLLISRWVEAREHALVDTVNALLVDQNTITALSKNIDQAREHFAQTEVPDEAQQARYHSAVEELASLRIWLATHQEVLFEQGWGALLVHSESTTSFEAQEALIAIFLELAPADIVNAQSYPAVAEAYQLEPEMPLAELRALIEQHYAWALAIDFTEPGARHYFWYYSEEKMEPRLGQYGHDAGQELAMPLVIAERVQACYQYLGAVIQASPLEPQNLVADFLLRYPQQRAIIKRIQTMSHQRYGEIRVNLSDQVMLPMDLLRCKLSFFGVSKFDPKSSLWVRNTMFQGAPLPEELSHDRADDWFLPVISKHDRHAVRAAERQVH